ncbi:hypothetical protein LWI28_014709 [Acer negundo]|uniref:Uncharacterized protein n=1 Tax=Acer negundo TaxID=4023 RepID=A0AAD5NEU8_ACENE|nr:hypothetical protein LWI28_014709 [Acer negundo]
MVVVFGGGGSWRSELGIDDVEYVDGGDRFDSVDGGVIDDYVLGLIQLMMVMKFLNFWVAFILTMVGGCLRLSKQVELFEETVKWQLQTYYKTSQELSYYLSKSLFLITIGSNDYISNYLDDTIIGKIIRKRISPDQFAQLLIDRLSDQLKRLHDLGGRKIVFFELGPIGCIPSITRKQKHSGKCVENTNQVISFFNNKLPGMLRNLTSTLHGSNFVLGHANWLGYDAVINPSKYGLTDSSNPCCIAWFNGTSGCVPFSIPCTSPDEHYFWDGYHLTQTMYSTLASRCINDSTVCMPFTLNQLIQM